MNRTEIVNLVLGRCGRREGDTYLQTQAKSELGLIQDRLELGAFMPWFLLSDETDLSSTANTRAMDLPASFLREYEDYKLFRYDAAADRPYISMNKDEYDYLQSRYGESEAGIPLEYSLSGEQFDLFPTPDAAYPFKWRFFEKQDALSDSVLENGWTRNAAGLLVAELGTVMAGLYLQNKGLLAAFTTEVLREHARLLAFDEARKQALRDAMRGDRDRP